MHGSRERSSVSPSSLPALLSVLTSAESVVADNQYNEIISSPDAWQISDDGDSGDSGAQLSADYGSRATTSARRFKALMERVTGLVLCF